MHPTAPARPPALALLAFLALAAATATGCNKATCTTEIADGEAKYKGTAEGKKGQRGLERNAKRDACRQMCAAKKAPILDSCAARCVTDIDAAKLGARTKCTDR